MALSFDKILKILDQKEATKRSDTAKRRETEKKRKRDNPGVSFNNIHLDTISALSDQQIQHQAIKAAIEKVINMQGSSLTSRKLICKIQPTDCSLLLELSEEMRQHIGIIRMQHEAVMMDTGQYEIHYVIEINLNQYDAWKLSLEAAKPPKVNDSCEKYKMRKKIVPEDSKGKRGSKKINIHKTLSKDGAEKRILIQNLLQAVGRIKDLNIKQLAGFLQKNLNNEMTKLSEKNYYNRLRRFMNDMEYVVELTREEIKDIYNLIKEDSKLMSDSEIQSLLPQLQAKIFPDPKTTDIFTESNLGKAILGAQFNTEFIEAEITSKAKNLIPNSESLGISASFWKDDHFAEYSEISSETHAKSSDVDKMNKPLIFSTKGEVNQKRLADCLGIKFLSTTENVFYIAPTAANLKKKLTTYNDIDELRFSLFAGQRINAGQKICLIRGKEISEQEEEECEHPNQIFNPKKGQAIYTKNEGSEARFIQGTPYEPNVKIIEDDGNLYYIALRDISPGDEIVAFFGNKYAFAKKPTTLTKVAALLNKLTEDCKIALTIDENNCQVQFVTARPPQDEDSTVENNEGLRL